MRRTPTMILALVAILALTALMAACGGDDEDNGEEAEETTATSAASADEQLDIEMGDFFFKPDDASVTAGSVGITAPNVGDVEHELVIFKTDENPADLPLSDGNVDVAALEAQGAEEIGELEAEAGETAEGAFDLAAGSYAMICNLPGHYQKGMYGSLTAK